MRGKGPVPLLVGSLATVMLGFLVAGVFMLQANYRVDAAGQRVQSVTVPEVHHLTAMRKAMIEIGSCAPAPSRSLPEILGCTAAGRDHFVAELAGYEALPDFPERGAPIADVRRALVVLDEKVGTLRATVDSRAQLDAAMFDLLATLGPLDDAVDRLSSANVRHTVQQSAQITSLLHKSELIELLLLSTAVSIAVFATCVAVRAVRRHNRLLETRADELEYFATAVAHDLLSPLSSLSVSMPIIQGRHPDDEQTQRLTTRSLASVKRVRALVDGLLSYARAGATSSGARAEVQPVLSDVLAEVSEQAMAAGVEISVENVEGATACSSAVLYSILSNLLVNAVKHMGETRERKICLRAKVHDGRVLVEVEDTGPGVPPSLAGVIFEPHVRLAGASKPGLGLGLATVKRLVSAHGGQVGVSAAEPCGARFWFELPCPHRAAGPLEVDRREPPPGVGSATRFR